MTGSSTTYNVAVSGMAGSGTVIASIAGGVRTMRPATPTRPALAVQRDVRRHRPNGHVHRAAARLTRPSTSPVNFTVVFSKAVSDFNDGCKPRRHRRGNQRQRNRQRHDLQRSVSGMTNTGTVVASIEAGVAHDALGNPNSASTESTVTYVIQHVYYLTLITK